MSSDQAKKAAGEWFLNCGYAKPKGTGCIDGGCSFLRCLNSLAALLDAYAAERMLEARLEEAMLWLKATTTAPLCNVLPEELLEWKKTRIADLQRQLSAARGKK